MAIFQKLDDMAENVESPPANADNLTKLCAYWKFIRLALSLIMIFTGKKADKKIQEIIDWGDTVCTS